MASIGNALLNLMGNKDPRQRLMAAALGGSPAGGGSTPAGAAGGPGGAAPQRPPQPDAYTSPPDLLSLYEAMSERTQRANSISTGVGLLASAFAVPENRANIIAATTGNEMSESDIMNTVLSIQERQKEIADRAARQARARKMAADLGIDEETALYLDESGQLGNLITSSMAKGSAGENNQIVTTPEGTFLVDRSTGQKIAEIAGPGQTDNRTAAIKDYDFYRKEELKAGRTPMTFNEFLQQSRGGTNVTVNNQMGTSGLSDADENLIGELDKELLATGNEAQASAATIQSINAARGALQRPGGIVAGSAISPLELEGRKLIADVFGVTDPAVINSQEYNSALGEVVLSKISALGTGNAISDADRRFLSELLGQSNTIPAEAMPRILNIVELGSRNQIMRYNERVRERLEASRDAEGNIPGAIAAALKEMPVPMISEGFMEFVPEGDRQQILKWYNAEDASFRNEFRRLFDEQYGLGAADAVYEYLTRNQ